MSRPPLFRLERQSCALTPVSWAFTRAALLAPLPMARVLALLNPGDLYTYSPSFQPPARSQRFSTSTCRLPTIIPRSIVTTEQFSRCPAEQFLHTSLTNRVTSSSPGHLYSRASSTASYFSLSESYSSLIILNHTLRTLPSLLFLQSRGATYNYTLEGGDSYSAVSPCVQPLRGILPRACHAPRVL